MNSKAKNRDNKKWRQNNKYKVKKSNSRSAGKLYIKKYATKTDILNFIRYSYNILQDKY